jgi:hypothetical protein
MLCGRQVRKEEDLVIFSIDTKHPKNIPKSTYFQEIVI